MTGFEKQKIKKFAILFLKLVAIEETLTFIFTHYFLEIKPTTISIAFIASFVTLIALNLYTKNFQRKGYFKPTHILLIVVFLFLAVHFRAGIVWAQNTFPLRNANMVLLTLQEPFDDFSYMMISQYLATTIPQALVITVILTIFLYVLLGSTQKKLIGIAIYFAATIAFIFKDIPVFNYVHILNSEPEKSASYSDFFVTHYINPDSIKITVPERKRNLILIYLESLETTFADKEHGGYQDSNLIPEITELALQNLNFGKSGKHIGGGYDAFGSESTLPTMLTRTLGIPNIFNYKKMPILQHYNSLYKILNQNGYHQIFFQGNPGLYKEFKDFALDQKINEIYGTDELIKLFNMDAAELTKKQGFKNIQDKDAFVIANQFLDTLSEPFTLTFFTIDTHAPHGFYDSDCIKIDDEKNEDEQLKASARCVSRELNKFLQSLKSKPFYDNTSIIVFGDHLFMGKRLVDGFNDRKWVNIFVNAPKKPITEENRQFTDVDMLPTILSSINFDIEGDRLALGTDLFSDKKTLVETIGLDSLNKEINKIYGHLLHESYTRYLLKEKLNQK